MLLAVFLNPVAGFVDSNKIRTNNEGNFTPISREENYSYRLYKELKSENKINIFDNCRNGDVVDQQQTKNCYTGWGVLDTQWVAQGFTPSLEVITRVQLYMFKQGEIDDIQITVSIRESLNGNDLTNASVNGSVVGYTPWWVEFDFEDITIIPGHKYYIVARAPDADDDNGPCWNFYVNNPYKGGDAWCAFYPDFNWVLLDIEGFPESDCCFMTYGLDDAPDKPTIDGAKEGNINTEYDYTFVTTDPETHDVYFFIEWGDDTNSGWIGPYSSGQQIIVPHSWEKKGEYLIAAKANDTYGAESNWSEFTVTMPRTKTVSSSPLMRFLKRYPLTNILLQKLKSL
jgi:hypothetical protein